MKKIAFQGNKFWWSVIIFHKFVKERPVLGTFPGMRPSASLWSPCAPPPATFRVRRQLRPGASGRAQSSVDGVSPPQHHVATTVLLEPVCTSWARSVEGQRALQGAQDHQEGGPLLPRVRLLLASGGRLLGEDWGMAPHSDLPTHFLHYLNFWDCGDGLWFWFFDGSLLNTNLFYVCVNDDYIFSWFGATSEWKKNKNKLWI